MLKVQCTLKLTQLLYIQQYIQQSSIYSKAIYTAISISSLMRSD